MALYLLACLYNTRLLCILRGVDCVFLKQLHLCACNLVIAGSAIEPLDGPATGRLCTTRGVEIASCILCCCDIAAAAVSLVLLGCVRFVLACLCARWPRREKVALAAESCCGACVQHGNVENGTNGD